MSELIFSNHEVVNTSPEKYIEMSVAPSILIKAWAQSMFSYELLTKDGNLKPQNQLKPHTIEKLAAAKNIFVQGGEIIKPVIGVGIMDNIEIGIGCEIVVAAYDVGITEMPVHARVQQLDEVQKLLKAI